MRLDFKAVTPQYPLKLEQKFARKLRISINPIDFHLVFKSLTHCIEDERVDSRVNVTHRVSNNLIKTII